MRRMMRRCALALLAMALLVAAVAPAASAMVYGSIDRYSGRTINIRENSSAYMSVGKLVRLRMVELDDRQVRQLRMTDIRSSRPSVAYVTPGGWVKAMNRGTAVITMTAKDGRQYRLTLTVIRSATPTRIWFSDESLSTRVGQKLALAPYLCARPITEVLASRRVLWTSSDTKVALVSSTGELTPRRPGVVTVTAACDGLKATVRVRVRERK